MYNPEEVVDKYKNAIYKVANTYYYNNPRFSYEDLVAEAECAAIVACDSYKSDRNATFFTYLTSSMDREVQKFVNSNKYDINVTSYQGRKEFKNSGNLETINNKANAIRIDFMDGDNESRTSDIIASGSMAPDEILIKKESIEVLHEEIDKLPDREKLVIRLRKFDGLTLQEVASIMDTTKQTVHGWEKRGLERLEKRMRFRLDG